MIASITDLIVSVSVAGLLYCIIVIWYRLTLHPLAKYPGPFLAKITSLYDTYHSYREDRHLDQLRCQQKYGSVFRYGPNYLVIQTAGALRDIYTHAKSNNIRKSDYYRFFHDKDFASTVHATNTGRHAFKRKVLSHGFSEQALHALEPFMVQNIDKWLIALAHGATSDRLGWSSPKNMSKLTTYLTLDVLGDLCFGKSFDMLTSDENHGIERTTIERPKFAHIVGNSPFMSVYKFLQRNISIDKYLTPDQWRMMQMATNFAIKNLQTRQDLATDLKRSGQEPRKDFVYWLSQGKDPDTGEGFSRRDLLTDLRVLVVAGSDTTATTIAAAFDLLTKNPQVLDKLQNQVRQTFSNIDDIVTGPRLSGCHYLRAVIDETLRLAPSVPSSLPRNIEVGGTVIDGIALPAGIQVGTAAWGMHRSPEYWTDPLVFRPERWISEYTAKDEIERGKSAFCAFSLGIRGCVGKTMAYNEVSIALARAFWKFDVRRLKGDMTGTASDGLFNLQDCYVARKDGPMIELREHVQR